MATSTSMIERVACALAASKSLAKFPPQDQRVFRLAAREAIKAMKRPTPAMKKAGSYKAMIDAALKGA